MKIILISEFPNYSEYKAGDGQVSRVGDTVINEDLTFIVDNVMFNYDYDVIRVYLKRPKIEK